MCLTESTNDMIWMFQMDNFQSRIVSELLQVKKAKAQNRPCIIGVYGPQGSGKTTLSLKLCQSLSNAGFSAVTVSLDDFYYSKAKRQELSQSIHPLLATRGVPGTHDDQLGMKVFSEILNERQTQLPIFNKAVDDLAPHAEWHQINKVDFLIFEGWCVGLPDVLEQDLVAHPEPINSLEAEHDADGKWRQYVAHRNKDYQKWYAMIDHMIGIGIPSFDSVANWRWQQECELFRNTGKRLFNNQSEVRHFISFFERVTRAAQNVLTSFTQTQFYIDDDHEIIKATLWSQSR